MNLTRSDIPDLDAYRAFGTDLAVLLLRALATDAPHNYADQLRRFDGDPAFRAAFEGLLEALDATVIERHERLGILIGLSSDASPLAERVDQGMSVEDKRLLAVAFSILFAVWFPEGSLDDETMMRPPYTVLDFYGHLARILDNLRQSAQAVDSPTDELWTMIQGRMTTERTAKNRFSKSGMAGQIETALRILKDRRLVMESVGEMGESAYRPTQYLTIYAKRMVNQELYLEITEALRNAAQKQE